MVQTTPPNGHQSVFKQGDAPSEGAAQAAALLSSALGKTKRRRKSYHWRPGLAQQFSIWKISSQPVSRRRRNSRRVKTLSHG